MDKLSERNLKGPILIAFHEKPAKFMLLQINSPSFLIKKLTL
jgi:hypothetical protein